MKKYLYIFISVLFVLTGCSKTGSTNTIEETEKSEYKPEKIRIGLYGTLTDEDDIESIDKLKREYEKNTGIKIEFRNYGAYGNSDIAKKEIFSDSKEMCDVIELSNYDDYINYVRNGCLWDMSDSWENSELKNSGLIEEKYVDFFKTENIDGNVGLYGFPKQKGSGYVTYIRKDWLDTLGISEPETYDQFIDMLRQFKGGEYTYKNGKVINYDGIVSYDEYKDLVDVYPFVLPNGCLYYSHISIFLYDIDIDFRKGPNKNQMRTIIERIKSAYDEGLVKLYGSQSNCRELFFEVCAVGGFNCDAGKWNKIINDNLKEKNEKYSAVVIDPIENGKYFRYEPYCLVINDKCGSEEHKKAVFENFISYIHDGGEGELLFTRGVEGYHWEEKDGIRKMIHPLSYNEERILEKIYLSPYYSISKNYREYENFEKDSRIESSLDILEKNQSNNFLEFNSYNYCIPVEFTQAIKGTLTIDEALDKYYGNEEKLGLNEIGQMK
ncbi:MAG: extracellular solute-binding protein [Firmicutes bacterium]|nr:extracellular solute-binding protein [Bacillota bacterium]